MILTSVFSVAGSPSSGSRWVNSVMAEALAQTASLRFPSMLGASSTCRARAILPVGRCARSRYSEQAIRIMIEQTVRILLSLDKNTFVTPHNLQRLPISRSAREAVLRTRESASFEAAFRASTAREPPICPSAHATLLRISTLESVKAGINQSTALSS